MSNKSSALPPRGRASQLEVRTGFLVEITVEPLSFREVAAGLGVDAFAAGFAETVFSAGLADAEDFDLVFSAGFGAGSAAFATGLAAAAGLTAFAADLALAAAGLTAALGEILAVETAAIC
jgi:hypothetical protein